MDVFARAILRRRHQAHDDGDAFSLARNVLGSLAIVFDKPGTLHQVARRIAANGELRKHHQLGAAAASALRVIDDFCGVSGEIGNGGVDLPECNPHI